MPIYIAAMPSPTTEHATKKFFLICKCEIISHNV